MERVVITTLTPLWTGDISQSCFEPKLTSIIGSLRWWFESIVRGFGYYACDSTGEICKQCNAIKKENNKNSFVVCPVCKLFGTTGLVRQFRIKKDANEQSFVQLPFLKIVVQGAEKNKVQKAEKNRKSSWFLGSPRDGGGLFGSFSLRFYVDSIGYDVIKVLLALACNWGLGAKTQVGFGICKIGGITNLNNSIKKLIWFIEENKVDKLRGKQYDCKPSYKLLPNLEKFFFARIFVNDSEQHIEKLFNNNNNKTKFKAKLFTSKGKEVNLSDIKTWGTSQNQSLSFYPTGPIIRYWLRSLFRSTRNSGNKYSKIQNSNFRHFLLGFTSFKKKITPMCKEHLIHTHPETDYRKSKEHKAKKIRGRKNRKTEKKRFVCPECDDTLKDDAMFKKMGSKIFVSHIFWLPNSNRWEFRIWGYVPDYLPAVDNTIQRNDVMQYLYTKIYKEKAFAEILNLEKESLSVEWFEIGKNGVRTVKDLLKNIMFSYG